MKPKYLILLPLLLLAGCSTNNKPSLNVLETYIDDSMSLSTSDLNVRVEVTHTTSESTDVYVKLYLTNLKVEKIDYQISSCNIIRESSGAKYNVIENQAFSLESEVENYSLFTKSLPSRIDSENYYLQLTDSKNVFKFKLYNNPANYFTVNFKVDNEIVFTKQVHKGDQLGSLYTYEYPNHLKYSKKWKNGSTQVSSSTVIENDVDLSPIEEDAINMSTTNTDQYSFVNGVNYVFKDKICVLPDTYKNKPINISLFAIKDIDITDLYLPITLSKIYMGNFTGIAKLTIHYAGSQNDWTNNVTNSSEIGNNITFVYNSSFTF